MQQRRSTSEGRSSTRRPDGGEARVGGTGRNREMERRGTSPSMSMWPRRTLRTTNPLEMMRRYSDEMGRMFDNWGFRGLGDFRLSNWPAIEMFDRDHKLIVRAELPGMRREDVHVRVVGDSLLLEGERRNDHEERREGYHETEWTYGHFSRQIPLPQGVDTTRLMARMHDGVLEISVPYNEQYKAREITIEESKEPITSGRTR